MSLVALAEAIKASDYTMLSTDLFDTVLLRDHTTESERLDMACRRGAPRVGVDPEALARMRWSFHDSAYRAVAMERPGGDIALSVVYCSIAAALGLGEVQARVLRDAEVEVDIEHLRPNRPLIDMLWSAARSGTRVIAVSDTSYGASDLRRILDAVVGPHPIAAVYSSGDLALPKQVGPIFAEVARRENVRPDQILHVGDNTEGDVHQAVAASWTAVHLPRGRLSRGQKIAGRVLSVPVKLRRNR